MKKYFYLLTILGLLLQPGLASLYGAAAQVGGDEPQSPQDVTLFVKPAPTGAENCSSWDNACGLQTALGAASSGDEIWAQAGTYKPTAGSDRTVAFALKTGVEIYGGFAGTETSREQRDWVTHVTILSGDIGVAGDTSDNSYHVVSGSWVDANALLDGFTITLGNANGYSPWNSGGGLYNDSGNPSITNVTFSGNTAAGAGGGMDNRYGSPTITNVTFSANTAAVYGGGMYNRYGSPTITNVTFSANTAAHYGGGLCNAGSSPTITNVTFSANTAAYFGGGMYNYYASPTLTNVILWGNIPDQMYNDSGTPVVSYSDIQGGYSGVGNIDADPLFVNTVGGNLRLQLSSPAIDAGNNAAVPAGVLTDLEGKPRFVDIPGVRDPGAIVDMGAYEAQNVVCLPILRKRAVNSSLSRGSLGGEARRTPFMSLLFSTFPAQTPPIFP